MSPFPARLALLAAVAATLPPAHAQTGPDPATLTLSVGTRLIIEDVLVTNRNGHPVHGLPAAAFHVTDNGLPQTLRSFEEGSAVAAAAVEPLPVGTFRNMGSTDVHSASEVLLLDADSMRVEDQMYLLQQLDKALLTIPANLQIAVFRVINGRIVQIRGLGNDRADTHRAIHECLPVLTHAIDNPFGSAVDQLLTVAAYLQQTPGRKNILWFAGSFPLISVDDRDPGGNANAAARQRIIHELQEALAEARVSVYPVDVRGVIPLAVSSTPNGSPIPSTSAPGSLPQGGTVNTGGGPLGTVAEGVVEQRNQMRSIADVTGGKAYTLNHVAEEVTDAFDLGARAYSLSYTPTHYITDDSWHRIRITIDPTTAGGPFQLSYRLGYLATWTGVPGGRVGIRLGANEKVATGNTPVDDPATPLPFTVHIDPGTPNPGRKPALPLAMHFAVPVDELSFKRAGDRWRNELLIASYVYDGDGKIKTGHLQQYTTSLTDAQFTLAKHLDLPAQQTLVVPGNVAYLMLELRDIANKRVGNLMIPVRAVRALPVAAPASASPAPASMVPAAAPAKHPLSP